MTQVFQSGSPKRPHPGDAEHPQMLTPLERELLTLVERLNMGVSGISCTGVRLNISVYALAAWKRSAKRTANWDLAIAHSLAGIFHSFSDLFKTRYRSLVAASSEGKWPLARTARRSLEFKASMAFVV